MHGGRGLGHVKVDVEVRCTSTEAGLLVLLFEEARQVRDLRMKMDKETILSIPSHIPGCGVIECMCSRIKMDTEATLSILRAAAS